MYQVILLKSETAFAREQWPQVDDVVDYEGVSYSLRAGPRASRCRPTTTGTPLRCMRRMRSAKRNSRTGTRCSSRRWKSCG